MTTADRVIEIIRKAAGLAGDEPIGARTALVGSGVGLDSVAVLEVLVALEKEFGVELGQPELDETRALRTVGSLTELVESKIAGGR